MAVERKNPDRIVVLGGNDDDVAKFIESDFKIRSGMCPNGHGLMSHAGWGQQCPICKFTCNTMPDQETPQ